MFKSRPLHDQEPSDVRAQVLGEKSGKYEYFAAREDNRSNIADALPPPPISAVRETLNKESEESIVGAGAAGEVDSRPWASEMDSSQSKVVNKPVDTVDAVDTTETTNATTNTTPEPQGATHVDLRASIATQNSPWSMSGERFINNPGTEDLPTLWVSRHQSPEFDMTSAYTFQQSKMATEGGASHPRRVGIQDLLTQEPKNSRGDASANRLPPITISPPSPHRVVKEANDMLAKENVQPIVRPYRSVTSSQTRRASKRSHEDAFADEDDWPGQDNTRTNSDDGPSSGLTNDETPRAVVSNAESVHESLSPQTELMLRSLAIPARRDNVQPSKKRRFARAAAYVALGGAAALTYMVSTAPVL